MSPTAASHDVLSEVAGIIPDAVPGGTLSIDELGIQCIAAPQTVEQVEALVRAAAGRFGIIPGGGLTKQETGNIPDRTDVLLTLRRLDQVRFYDPGDLTLGVGAGMTIAALNRLLAEHGQFLPLDVAHPEQATIGGVLATAAHGPLRAGYGGIRDFCIGIEFVTGKGSRVHGGGRVVKNVAGYDLMKLLIGSYGTLGVITSANFKVFPFPRQTCTFACEFAAAAQAVAFRDRVITSPLGQHFQCFEIASPRAPEYFGASASPPDPDHWHPARPVETHGTWTVYVRAAGSDRVLVRYRQELSGVASHELTGDPEQALWRSLAQFGPNVVAKSHNAMLLAIHSPLQEVAGALAAAEQTAVEYNLVFAAIGRITAGTLLVACVPLAIDPPNAIQYAGAVSALRGRVSSDTSVIVLRCPVEAKRHFDVWGSTPTDVRLMRGIRAALDPQRTLNSGRFIVP